MVLGMLGKPAGRVGCLPAIQLAGVEDQDVDAASFSGSEEAGDGASTLFDRQAREAEAAEDRFEFPLFHLGDSTILGVSEAL